MLAPEAKQLAKASREATFARSRAGRRHDMGILDRLFGKNKEAAPVIEDSPADQCPHGSLGPHWDNAADFGKRDLISFYICQACGTKFGRDEGEQAMTKAAGVVKVDMSMRKAVQDAADAAEADRDQT